MNIRKELEKGHSRTFTNRIVNYVGDDEKRFSELVAIFLSGPYRITQRAAWPVSVCSESNPQLIRPHLKKILDHLEKPGIHDAVKRNVLRLLQFIEIPKRNHDQVANLCFQYLADKKEPVAIRVFAMSALADLSRSHPDLKQELKILIEDNLPFSSAAFRSRATKILRELNRI